MTIIHSFKQNLSLAWLLGPQTQGKLLHMTIIQSFKQNLSPAWLLGPQTQGKLSLMATVQSFKQNLSPAWLLGPQTQRKLLLKGNYFKVRAQSSVIATLIQIRCTTSFFLVHLYLFISLQTLNKGIVSVNIHRKQRERSILIFQSQYKERSLQKNKNKTTLIQKKKGVQKLKPKS